MITGNPNTWSDYGTNTKSIYDPCPYGYRVPKNGSWNGFTINCPLNADGTSNNTPEHPAGKWINGSIIGGSIWNSTWWPAAGERYFTAEAMSVIGVSSRYWSSTPPSTAYQALDLLFHYNGIVDPNTANYRSFGWSVRCVQEEQEK